MLWPASSRHIRRWFRFIAMVFLLLTVRKLYYSFYYKKYKYPPGPGCGYPLFGYFIHLLISPKKFLTEIAKKYGQIVFVPIGMNNVIYINNSKLVNKLYKTKEFYHRYGLQNGSYPPYNFAVVQDNKKWIKRRAYAQRSLFSLCDSSFILKHTKNILYSEIFVEIDKIYNYSKHNTLWFPINHISHIAFNNIFTAIFDTTLPMRNPWVKTYIKEIETRNDSLTALLLLNTFFPYNLPNFISNMLCSVSKREKILDKLLIGWMQNEGNFTVDISRNIMKRNENYERKTDKNANVYIDALIEQVNKNNITVLEAIHDVQNFFVAGLHTTISASEYGFLLLAKYPNLQQDIYNELSHVIGKCDKTEFDFDFIQKLHKFRAFVYELLRIADLVPTGIPHTIHKDYKIKINEREYVIPAQSIININGHYIHKWQSWNNNKSTDNECKLNEDNDIHLEYWLNDKKQFTVNDNLVSFGVGKRDCVGRAFAIQTLFTIFGLFITNYIFIAPGNLNDFQIKQKWGGVKEVQPKIGIYIQKRA